MNSKFKCPECLLVFESEGRKEEYTSITYGPCFKYVANCPACGADSTEYRPPVKKQVTVSNQPVCGAGGCCHCN